MIGIKTIIFVLLLAIVLYRASFIVRMMKIQEVVYNHEPGPCKVVRIRNESCANMHTSEQECADWVARGECTNNQAWMYEHCAHSCHQCEDRNKPLLGSEDFAELGDGKYLVSSGVKIEEYQIPERKGAVFLLDLNTPSEGAQQTKLVWSEEKIDTLNPHGISILRTEAGKVLVFLVNHDEGEAVERFEYDVTTNTLTHLETITNSAFKFLHSIQATGERSFFVTDYGGSPILTLFTGLRLGKVLYCEGEEARVVANDYFIPNGLQISSDNRYLYVAHVGDMNIETFSIQEDFSLEKVHVLEIYKSINNMQLDLATGDMWLGATPSPYQDHEYSHDPEDENLISASQVFRVKMRAGIPTDDIADVYANKGDVIKGSSVAAHYNDRLLIGSTFHKTLLCQILHS